jgi:hypothetical protein
MWTLCRFCLQEEANAPAGGRRGSVGARTADPNFIGYTYKNWDAVRPPPGSAGWFPVLHAQRAPCLSDAYSQAETCAPLSKSLLANAV